jgi:hypothetical protein
MPVQSALGINAGDIGDSFMDAPALPDRKKGSGSGENFLSSLFDAIGIHVGGKPLFDKAGKPLADQVAPAQEASPQASDNALFDLDGNFKGIPKLDKMSFETPTNLTADLSQITTKGVGGFDIQNLFSTLTGIFGL